MKKMQRAHARCLRRSQKRDDSHKPRGAAPTEKSLVPTSSVDALERRISPFCHRRRGVFCCIGQSKNAHFDALLHTKPNALSCKSRQVVPDNRESHHWISHHYSPTAAHHTHRSLPQKMECVAQRLAPATHQRKCVSARLARFTGIYLLRAGVHEPGFGYRARVLIRRSGLHRSTVTARSY